MTPEPSADRRRHALAQAFERGISLRELLAGLSDADWRVRRCAIDLAPARILGDDVVAGLVAALSERDNIELRNAVVALLGRLGASVFPKVISVLTQQDEEGRKLAVEVLSAQPDVTAVQALVSLLGDADANVRLAAIEALAQARLAGADAWRFATTALCGLAESNGELLPDDVKLAIAATLGVLGCSLKASVLTRWLRSPVVAPVAIHTARYADDSATLQLLVAALATPEMSRLALSSLASLACLVRRKWLQSASSATRLSRSIAIVVPSQSADWLRDIVTDCTRPPAVRLDAATVLNAAGVTETKVAAALLTLAADEEWAEAFELLFWNSPEALVPLLVAELAAAPRGAIRVVTSAFQRSMPEQLFVGIFGLFIELPEMDRAPVLAMLYRSIASAPPLSAQHISTLVSLTEDSNSEVVHTAMLMLASEYRSESAWIMHESHWLNSAKLRAAFDLGAAYACASSEATFGFAISKSERRNLLGHEDWRVREFSLRAIFERTDITMADDVCFALTDDVREVALQAIRVLERFARIDPLVSLSASSTEPWLQAAALAAVGRLDSDRLIGIASGILERGDVRGIANAAMSLSFLDEPARMILHQVLKHPEVTCVTQALRTLAFDADVRTEARIGELLGHAQPLIRHLSADALRNRGESARALLRARLTCEPEAAVRSALFDALSEWSSGVP